MGNESWLYIVTWSALEKKLIVCQTMRLTLTCADTFSNSWIFGFGFQKNVYGQNICLLACCSGRKIILLLAYTSLVLSHGLKTVLRNNDWLVSTVSCLSIIQSQMWDHSPTSQPSKLIDHIESLILFSLLRICNASFPECAALQFILMFHLDIGVRL